jgi:outer membrane receptor protein involved in Fe transport
MMLNLSKYYPYLVICLTLMSCGFARADVNEADNSQQEVYQLEEISVTPGRFSISESAPSPYLIPKAEMEKLPLIDNDIYRATHNLPGVVADDFSARFAIRGGDRDEIVIRLDGMELYDPYHLQDFGGAISVIDMGIVRNADLLTGGFPAEYGDAMSGVFDVTSGAVSRGKISGNAGIDMLNTHLILGGPLSEASWLLSARRGYIDLLMGLIESEETFKPSYYDLYGKMSYDIQSSDTISAHVLYAGDSNEIDRIGDESDLDSRYWNGAFWARWRHLASEKMLWNLYLFSGSAGREKYEGIDGIDERSLLYAGLKGDAIYSPVSSQTLKAGWRWQQAEANYRYFLREDETPISVDAAPSGWDLNGYIQDEWRISRRLAGNLGLRCIYQNDGGHFAIMPRAALAAKLRKDLTVRGAWGIYNQPVQIANLPVEAGIAESQPPEKAVHYILAAEYSPAANLLLRTEAYYKTFDDLAGQIKDYGRKEQSFISPESGFARGVEIFAKHAFTPRFTWGLGYALSKAEVETETGNIPRDFDRRHSLSLSADYAIWNDGWINAVWRYHTGDPYTEMWYEKAISEDGGFYVWQKSYGEVNGMRYPAYHSLDVRLTKNFRFKNWELILYFQILNLYNRGNIHEYSFEQTADGTYHRIAEKFLPILPALGLSAQF